MAWGIGKFSPDDKLWVRDHLGKNGFEPLPHRWWILLLRSPGGWRAMSRHMTSGSHRNADSGSHMVGHVRMMGCRRWSQITGVWVVGCIRIQGRRSDWISPWLWSVHRECPPAFGTGQDPVGGIIDNLTVNKIKDIRIGSTEDASKKALTIWMRRSDLDHPSISSSLCMQPIERPTRGKS